MSEPAKPSVIRGLTAMPEAVEVDGEVGASDDAKTAAAEAVMSALQSNDVAAFSDALSAFVDASRL